MASGIFWRIGLSAFLSISALHASADTICWEDVRSLKLEADAEKAKAKRLQFLLCLAREHHTETSNTRSLVNYLAPYSYVITASSPPSFQAQLEFDLEKDDENGGGSSLSSAELPDACELICATRFAALGGSPRTNSMTVDFSVEYDPLNPTFLAPDTWADVARSLQFDSDSYQSLFNQPAVEAA